MKLTRKHIAIVASVVLLAMGAPGCKRADNSTDAGAAATGASGTMNNPAAAGAMSPGSAAAASGASQ
ncbi:hypothetical protein [Paraburkholderia lacunae]|uniref:Lipoprotein n=1 Tax=Paraburkholderia lacunae TaxID=2211104 RepID=A0A370MVF6_9BURK|nr:hypothetical protein [Paraburkholderia lacunae]RDJ97314.1 hypothetical protein DLM46_38125 [Paraburkholderia lacunae]